MRSLLLLLLLVSNTAFADFSGKLNNNNGVEPTQLETLGERSAKTGIFVLGVLLVGLSLIKRYQKKEGSTSESITILSRKIVAPRAALLIVTVEGRKLLLSQSGEELRLVTDLTPTVQDRTFAEILSEVAEEERPPIALNG